MYLFKGVSCTYCCALLVPIPPCVCTCDCVLVYLSLVPRPFLFLRMFSPCTTCMWPKNWNFGHVYILRALNVWLCSSCGIRDGYSLCSRNKFFILWIYVETHCFVHIVEIDGVVNYTAPSFLVFEAKLPHVMVWWVWLDFPCRHSNGT